MDISTFLNFVQTHYSTSFLVPFLFFFSVVLFLRNRSSAKLNLPPSPPRLPIIGNLHQLGTCPHHSLKALSDKYGPLMLLKLGHIQTLVVSSADIVKEILKSHDVVMCNRPTTTAAEIFLFGGRNIVHSPYGEYWRQVKKMCVVQLLSSKRVQQFQYVREEEVALMADQMHKTCLNGSSINMSDMLMETANNIICRCAIGQRSQGEGGGRSYGEISRKAVVQYSEFCVGDFFPSFGWIDHLRGFIRSLKSTAKELSVFTDQVVDEHKAGKNDSMSDKKDFVDFLFQIQKDNVLDFELTRADLKALIQDMLIGGTETTSSTSDWLMAELVRNPRVMKKAQDEVRRVVGKKGKIDMNDIDQMEYLKCVIKEALRLHPPVPLLAPRETTESIELAGFHIPAKTRVLINAWAIQRNPSSWDMPEEFFPERFDNSTVDFKGQDSQFIPFGFGRRSCPGIAFAIAGMDYTIAHLLYWFDWKLPADGGLPEDLDMSEVFGITIHKKVPLHLVATPYTP
ncbi:hypothetical protein UlMin_007845 [Ulmus minor]